MSPIQITLGERFRPEPGYSGRGFRASARVLWEGVLGLSKSTLRGGYGPEPEYSGRGFTYHTTLPVNGQQTGATF